MSQDAAQCDGLSRDPRVFVSLRQLLHPGTEPTNAAMMLLTVVGLGANVASALLLAHPTRILPYRRHPRDQAHLVPGGAQRYRVSVVTYDLVLPRGGR